MIKNIMRLGDVIIDLNKVSGILKNDTDVHHLGKSSTSTYNFTVILDGHPVKISFATLDERNSFKEKMIQNLGWAQ